MWEPPSLASLGLDIAAETSIVLATAVLGGLALWLFGYESKPIVPLAPAGLTPLPPGAYPANTLERQVLLAAGEIAPGWVVYVVPDATWPNPIEIGALPTAGAWLIRESTVESLLAGTPTFAPDPPPTQAWGPTPTPTAAPPVDWTMIAGLG